ncbi:MAG: hypothetical protein A2X18_00875 [Bacteroidetes bacterium GWF2_40_14]|nr:MAG: hypothetical protein A2X18_00875 [Bacteroidetes bacterium GWF2_40_14]
MVMAIIPGILYLITGYNKDTIKFFGLLVIVLTIITSCSKDFIVDSFKSDNYSIRSIVADGRTNQKFIYNESGKITESQSFYFYNKYTYDINNRLTKQEIAVDQDIYSSLYHIKSELMTSQNSTFTGYYIFEYNSAGKLLTQKNFFNKNGQFEYTSMCSLEYQGDNIVKWNLYDNKNILTQFYTYEYDSKGNVTKEKYYSLLESAEAKLVRESSFIYDDKNNPFKIYKDFGHPGIYSNTNNIIETNSILHEEVPGIDKFSTSRTTYKYNHKDYPISVNNAEEYIYE